MGCKPITESPEDINAQLNWIMIDWDDLEKRVYKLQKRIYKASRRDDVKTVRRLQKTLTKSWAAKCLAVRRVTQDNQGKKTAGVDGVKSLTPKQRLNLIDKLKLGTKVKPTRRVWIPKPGTEEKRPLGIPTMYDRALQGLVKLALEPEWEAKFEPNSYGFRPGRSCQDAIGAIFLAINKKAKYVLDADIAKCFDRIDHEQLLNKLNTYPTLRKQIRAWLKAGVMDGKELFPTSEGTPQGGVISPLLANIALHGMENEINKLAETFDMRGPDGKLLGKRDKRKSVSLIRYADDFVILHEDITIVQRCKEFISEWLKDMGLELKPSKTRLAHTLEEYNKEKPGFDFLGFNVRQHKVGKFNSGRVKGKLLGFKTIITPSKESQKRHYKKIAETIEKHKGKAQAILIRNLNPIIRGWCNYFSTVVSQKVFERLWHLTVWKLIKWGLKRHRNKGRKFIVSKYFQNIGGNNWAFATRQEGKNPMRLLQHSDTTITRYVKVKDDASPYNGDLIYWSSRMGKHPEMSTRTALLLKKQKGKCAHCGLFFKEGDVIELDHIIPKSKGGKNEYKNWQLLHRHCHDEKTRNDGSLDRKLSHKSIKFPKNYRWENDILVTC
ncbi:RNA-directed DNA polymerase (Reverse transcriptase) [Rippkaea orientalis PCC 8801]|uniref:RNA-directed DNA polymerase (Reverse transcriptase) n=2 Tax=Rippkaea TaxID=2546365 RepID=B7JWA9_RIPO1|nr:RNA-directed DNA polymerase (Reverse transcriptase) [Rippkaea orientalis PCC 8801]ACK65461.1 RNA-directed DNA polymerase (Reverse transcriptase) [Rippkaea orientalis PCC 8801]ACK66954.1 RNA-directed DNA polymerase (Reverse transcriptase) [Rippkaea orientalis PCC 8801]ACK66955.1 RNA-directed DNA polymerase (Reverse transcriptase) [Rippkaea orientalis PCC 8801]